MITIPVWLFGTMCGSVGLLALLFVRALVVADRRVDRILAEELGPRPVLPPVGSDIARDGAPVAHPVRVTVTDRAPRRGRP